MSRKSKALYTIKVQAQFNAAHHLRGYKGRCERLHGHNWKVEVQIQSALLNKVGLVYDFKEAKKKLAKVLSCLDHSYLNKLAYFRKNNPTSEKIAEFIYARLKKLLGGQCLRLKEVAVWETESSSAAFSELEA